MRHKPLAVACALAAAVIGTTGASAGIEDELRGPLTEARRQAHEAIERNVKIDLLEKLTAPMPFEGVATLSGPAVPTTLYFHSQAPLGTLDELNEFTASGPGPFMDPNPPTDPTPSVATSTGAGNLNFRKNFLNAYWSGKVNGIVGGDPTVSFWIAAPALKAEVAIFGDGGVGATSPAAVRSVDVVAPVPTLVSVKFPGLEMAVHKELVVQISARLDPASNNMPATIYYDTPLFASAFSFTLGPLVELIPKLDDPIGIIRRASDLVISNAGTGHVVVADTTGTPQTILAGGLVPGGFARGVTGLAADAAGTVYAAVADTGEILFVPPSGTGGVYARGLGAPVGIAFDGAGNLYVADAAGRRVVRIEPAGTRTVVASGFAAAPYGLALAPDGTMAVSTQRDAKVYSIDLPGTGAVTQIAGLGAEHSADGIAYAASGNLYIGDGRAGRLVRRTTSGALEEVAKDLGGPLNLTFVPSSTKVAVATQGEGRTDGDAVLEVETGEAGLGMAAPSLTPAALPAATQTWVHKAGAVALDPASVTGPLASTAPRYTGRNAFEPTMGIQADGDVYTTGGDFDQAGGVLGSPKVYHSADNGNSWNDITPKDLAGQGNDSPLITLDPYVYVDETTGRVFNPELQAACIYLNYADNPDSSDDWATNPIACGVPPVDHQTIVAAKPRVSQTVGYPNVVYHCSNWVTHSPCGRSLDGGKTWQPAGIAQAAGVADIYRSPAERSATDAGVNCSSLTGHLGADPDGRIFLPRIACGRPIVAVSEDDGLTWTVSLIDPANAVGGASHESIVASDTAGTLFYAWIGRNRLPYVSVSTDHGKTWGPARMVAPPGVTEANLPSIAAGGPGAIAVLYMATTADYGYGARNYGKAGWNVYLTVTTDATAADPVFQTVAVTPISDPMIRGACGPGRCGNVFDFLDVIVDPAGRPWATFVDACTGPCALNRSAASTDAKGGVAPLLTGPNLRTGGSLSTLT